MSALEADLLQQPNPSRILLNSTMDEGRGKRRRREHHYNNNNSSLSQRLRRRPPPPPPVIDGDVSFRSHSSSSSSSSSSPLVMVTGLPSDCTVLELKSRLELYGPISRTRIDAVDRSGYITFRSNESAEAAISASLDPEFGIDIRSYKVTVCQASDTLMGWKKVTGASNASSKLLRAEIPLSKHGRSNKKLSPPTTSRKNVSTSESTFKGREIVAYDDLF